MKKVALVDLCKEQDFAAHRTCADSMDFLREEGIAFEDFASGANGLEQKIERFHAALGSDADLVWFIRGGVTCIRALRAIDWEKVAASGKHFYGISDFTHFSTMAVSRGATCHYGQGLAYIKDFLPTPEDRAFVTKLLREGVPTCAPAAPVAGAAEALDLSAVKLIGGYLPGFTVVQPVAQNPMSDRHLFIEYHSGARGESLDDLGFLIDQAIFALGDNRPKGFVIGHVELTNLDGSQIAADEINEFCGRKLSAIGPVYYVDHFRNTVTFS